MFFLLFDRLRLIAYIEEVFYEVAFALQSYSESHSLPPVNVSRSWSIIKGMESKSRSDGSIILCLHFVFDHYGT